jgi:DNA-directed RNA polymerase subunit RPC12/RpoP
MRIITYTCPDCGTITAGNVLEKHREMKCPGLVCNRVIRFSDLQEPDQQYMLENPELYEIE